jgi:acetoacetyl-CoA reductase
MVGAWRRQRDQQPARGSLRVGVALPAGRLARRAEIARGVVFLAADEAGFTSGITLSINGGKHMR